MTGSPGATHTLTLSGTAFPPETTGFIDFVVSYTDDDPTQTPTGLMDTAENVLKATDAHPLSMHPVVAGQIPTVISAAFTGPNTITVVFSELIAVSEVTNANFTNLILNDLSLIHI